MIADLAGLLGLSQRLLWTGFVVFLRVGALAALLPAFGEQSIPVRVRLGLAFAFTVVVLPSIAPDIPQIPQSATALVAILGTEVLAGLFFGLLLRFFVLALQIAGTVAAQSTSLSQIFGGSAGVDPQPAIGRVLVTAGLALAAAMGLHTDFAAYMIETYALVPIGQAMDPTVVADLGLAAVSHVFALGFTLAAPFVISSLVYNVTLGVINRAMPQLMVSFIGAPAITAGGLLLLAVCAPLMLEVWLSALRVVVDDPAGAFR
ncbi:type III secretion protein [Salipiger sp. IMCC34102]|uniref:flagellar biosynthetic protein FliR n=1 Tax=Salipiger sp. IMCC34102 TaxID=2510647 RepID=UPI00101DE792|nr:flagellar biosynthetic protein FliR [Salipiger sp. IMCC34102]RYH01562.1 type III secretion protein [Salipiger sp. IMCC34102]